VIKNFIAYKGKKFIIEWYYDSNGESKALEYFETLPKNRKRKLIYLFYVLSDVGKIFNEEKFRYEGNQVYVFKTSPDRFFCFFFDGAKIIITNAYEKKSSKMPHREKQKAIKAKENYIKRCKKGNYYE